MPAPRFAPAAYERAMAPLERWGVARQRHLTLRPARGRLLDVGARTGLNVAHYPPGVSAVAAEPDAGARRLLGARAEGAPVPVRVVAAGAPGLPFRDGSFDTVACTFLLCRVADPAAAIADVRRVLHADGELLFLEHIVGRRRATAAVQRAVAPAWSAAGGCHVDRDTIAELRAGGFVISDCERLAPVGRLSAGTVVRGRAIKRSGG
ncbi:MAG TPA: class I SAM-dependent methyltransferase [Acidimicrobiales bacterium]|nr:class I SAM-dependent methyltransferase [Acidimicrobiales bacterium]